MQRATEWHVQGSWLEIHDDDSQDRHEEQIEDA
jgi:hypothetical protein